MEIKGNLTTSIEANQCEYQAKGREKKLEIFRVNSLAILKFFRTNSLDIRAFSLLFSDFGFNMFLF